MQYTQKNKKILGSNIFKEKIHDDQSPLVPNSIISGREHPSILLFHFSDYWFPCLKDGRSPEGFPQNIETIAEFVSLTINLARETIPGLGSFRF